MEGVPKLWGLKVLKCQASLPPKKNVKLLDVMNFFWTIQELASHGSGHILKVCGGIPTILGLVKNAAGHQFGGTTKHAY